jgi:hypothetical protein
MSHYATSKTPFRDKSTLVEVLRSMFGSDKVEVFERDQLGTARGYRGNNRQAEIIIRRDVCGGYGDLAFVRPGSGKNFEMIRDANTVNPVELTRKYLELTVKKHYMGVFQKGSKSTENRIELEWVKG